MISGDGKVDIIALKEWAADLSSCQSYEVEGEQTLTQPVDDCLDNQLKCFKRGVELLQDGDDWRSLRGVLSRKLANRIFVASPGAVRVANYYECLVVPSDELTRKQIMSGFGARTEVSELPIIKDDTIIGCIGLKSDFIWEVYYSYFVSESETGSIEHTLANHEDILSLQLWDIANQDERDIQVRVDTLLVELSVQSELNIKRIAPDELWASPGERGRYRLIDKGKRFEPIPLAYFKCGITGPDPRMAYLHFYQVLEYFFVRAQNISFVTELNRTGLLARTPLEHRELREVLTTYTRKLREAESLKLVLEGCVDANGIRTWIQGDQSLVQTYVSDNTLGSDIRLKLDSGDNKLLSSLARRIYFFRCSIAHSKGDVDEFAARPIIHDEEIKKELPLLRRVAYDALGYWSYR